MTNEEFKEMYQEYSDELYHSWVTSLDPVKRAAQQVKQKAYNAAYYLRNKAKWLKYNAGKNYKAHQGNWERGVDMLREGNRRLQSGIESRLNKLTGWNKDMPSIPAEQLAARENAIRTKQERMANGRRRRRNQQRLASAHQNMGYTKARQGSVNQKTRSNIMMRDVASDLVNNWISGLPKNWQPKSKKKK